MTTLTLRSKSAVLCPKHDFKGNFRKNHVHQDMALPESMTLPEYLATTIFSVKLMHLCIDMEQKTNIISNPYFIL